MRHLNSGSKLGKQPAHRRAVLRSLVTNLIEHGRITTTLTRAKAARPVAEKMITLGKRDTLQSRRQAASYIMTPAATHKLFSEIAPKATPASFTPATASVTTPRWPSSSSLATNTKPRKRRKKPGKKNPSKPRASLGVRFQSKVFSSPSSGSIGGRAFFSLQIFRDSTLH